MMCYKVWKFNSVIPHRSVKSVVRVLTLSVFLFCALFAGTAVAATDNLSFLVNGKAIHMKKNANGRFNEDNWGFGFQYEFAKSNRAWIPFATVSGFKDSNNQASYYIGGGYMRRLMLSRKMDQLHVDAGLIGFAMSRQDYKSGDPFIAALPALSLGTKDVSINVTYIPKVHPKISELWFFQLKLSTRSLR
jgi:hypothetical protein